MRQTTPFLRTTTVLMIICCLSVLLIAGCGSDSAPAQPKPRLAYAVGINSVLHTIDGITWQGPNPNDEATGLGLETFYNDVSAFDGLCAWAAAGTKLGGKVLRTLDGGLTWTALAPKGAFTPSMLTQGIKALSRDTAWVVGDLSTIALTTDGGQTWKQFDNLGIDRDSPAIFYAVAAVDVNTVWAVGNDYSGNPFGLYTTNGGASWNRIDVSAMTAGKPLMDVSAADKQTVWVSQQGPGSGIFLSTNGGADFATAYPDGTIGDSYAVIAFSSNAAYAGFENSSFEITLNGGRDWAKQNIDGRLSITGLTVAENRIWAVGIYPDGDEQAGDGAILYCKRVTNHM